MKSQILKPGTLLSTSYPDTCFFLILSAQEKKDYYNSICLFAPEHHLPKSGEYYEIHFNPPHTSWIIFEGKR